MKKVIVREETVSIPTYEAGKASRLPMFFDKRVYQGSSGKVYPLPVTDSISDTKTEKSYRAVYLENEYLLIMILPGLGGRIQRIYDKTNGYDAVYYNEVIKPALVGLTGPWISGGIEFNWPQHHRPSTFEEVDITIDSHEDGSVTVWCGETEKMYHTKGMAGFTLRPDCAYLEVKGQLYNPTSLPQTFLWWANPAVAVNEHTKSIFPPDVHAVMDHGKRAVSKFPVATGTYYNVDYSEGVDISQYKNIPVPTSYMAYHSDYDFIGNFDFSRDAGLLHVADHHISPGKKQWTWGCGDFGKAWDRNLTDENGPYIELMTGVFTDNQPDFTFLAPYEEKRFVQYFMPYKAVGEVKNATKDIIINLEAADDKATATVYVTHPMEVSILLKGEITEYIAKTVALTPLNAFKEILDIDEESAANLTLTVKNADGKTLISYTPEVSEDIIKTPDAAEAAKAPEDILSLEELYLTALHLEQYRHATYSPEPYYLEGLKRDPTDIRLNNGYGRLLYRCARFEESEKHLRAALKKSVWKNPNPYDCEPYYNLALTLRALGKNDEAFDAFYKSAWDSSMQDRAFYQLACMCAERGEFHDALNFINASLAKGLHNIKARNLKTTLLRLLGREEEAKAFAYETVLIDPLDFGTRYELYRLTGDFLILNELTTIMHGDLQNYIELSLNYHEAGLSDEAAKVLAIISESDNPMLNYYIAYYSNSAENLEIAAAGDAAVCFPNRLTEIEVLSYAAEHNSSDANARYLLGNLYYDKGCFKKAIEYWEAASQLYERDCEGFAFSHRNLAIAYFNKLNDSDSALAHMLKAYRAMPGNARIFYELDRLYKQLNENTKKRLKDMADNIEIVEQRDDLYTEYITLLNDERYFDRAYKAIKIHKFHPWEGGEGKITRQYRKACIGLAKECYASLDREGAVTYLKEALDYPENLSEGRLITQTDNDIYYFLGIAYEDFDLIESNKFFEKATLGADTISSAMYYNDTPPELYFFRAMAYKHLGNLKKAAGMFNRLIDYGEAHLDDDVKIDYFAVSLPDFDVFDADLNAANKAHCYFMAALGCYGAENYEKSKKYTLLGLEAQASHSGLKELLYEVEKHEND